MAARRLDKLQRRWLATGFPHFCRMAFKVWQHREEQPIHWIALVGSAAATLEALEPRRPRRSRKRAEADAWLRRQLDGLGKKSDPLDG